MKIYFYAPFKPLGHEQPSGDLVIATGLYDYLVAKGHRMRVAATLRSRWIFWKPWLLPHVLAEHRRLSRRLSADVPDLWLTYHAYYKGPDVIGPAVTARTGVPYVIFQGAYATKRRRDLRTLAGFLLNRRALRAARHVFVNKRVDFINLKRLLPAERVTYALPGIFPQDFCFSEAARCDLRRKWAVDAAPVVLTAAMFRPGVKFQGLAGVIKTCGCLLRSGLELRLVVIGDGRQRTALTQLAQTELPGKALFVGKVLRTEMYRYYSAGDLFVFPGIGESLGMVFLEAQSCGLPVVAVANAGVPEVVADGQTALLAPRDDPDAFARAVAELLVDVGRRRKMGLAAQAFIRRKHDLTKNYAGVERILCRIAESGRAAGRNCERSGI